MVQAAASGRYRRIVLMSGDQDFIEAVRAAQAMGVEVWVIDIVDRQGHATSLSRALRKQADRVLALGPEMLRGYAHTHARPYAAVAHV